MTDYIIDTIIETKANDWQGLSRTWFTTGGQTCYMLHKAENTPQVGETLVGTLKHDGRMNLKFTKEKTGPFMAATPQGGAPTLAIPGPAPAKTAPTPVAPPPRTYKADPDKMEQDFTLEKARNMSIQRQVAVKGAIDLIVAGKRNYMQLYEAYGDIMHLLSSTDWRAASRVEMYPEDEPAEDVLPAEADVERLSGADAFDRALDALEEQDGYE